MSLLIPFICRSVKQYELKYSYIFLKTIILYCLLSSFPQSDNTKRIKILNVWGFFSQFTSDCCSDLKLWHSRFLFCKCLSTLSLRWLWTGKGTWFHCLFETNCSLLKTTLSLKQKKNVILYNVYISINYLENNVVKNYSQFVFKLTWTNKPGGGGGGLFQCFLQLFPIILTQFFSPCS